MKNLIMICALVLIGQVAKAGGFIEPYLGYATGKVEATVAAGVPVIGGQSFDFKVKGPIYGLRAGYQFILPWVALEASQFKGETDQDPSGDIKGTDIGVTAGLSLPIVRPYAGYVLSSKYESDSSEITGNGIKVGVGFGFIPLVHVNIEYITTTFKELDGEDISSVFSDYKSKTTAFTISYVF
ncbi:MAG: outer membrane beta-barrel protein [Bdellovibrionota bacterium]